MLSPHGWLAEGPPLHLVVTMGRRHERDLFGVPGRGRRHGFYVPGVVGSICASRPAAEPVYRSRQSLLSHSRSRWQGGPRPADAGRARAGAFGDRAYRGVFTPGAWPVGAIVPDLTGSRAEGTGSGRDHDGGSGQRLAARYLYTGAQRAGSRSRPSRRAAPSSRCPGWIWPRSCAFRKTAWSATTTAYHSSIASYRYRRARCVRTSSRRR